MNLSGSPRWLWTGILVGLWLFTAWVYCPGLKGSYLFDDFPNIVDNTAVLIKDPTWQDWRNAALSSPSHDLHRPLAMLSFAINTYFTGLAPWPMKFTNLLIHLLNGGLLWGVLNVLLRLPGSDVEERKVRWMAAGITAAWLLNPINLSGVLYVVQRMEALAQTFVLGGLWLYLLGRKRMLEGRPALALAASGIAGGAGLGCLCKESAALLPVYAFLIEVSMLRFRSANWTATRRLWAMYAVLLVVPFVAALAWILPRTISATAYAWRPFTLEQRLLTELRVLVSYADWTLLPRPQLLGFYHDDIVISQGWLSPPTTLLSGLLIAASIAAAFTARRKLPLFTLGIAWYFAAHLLTATIIPLELVFEHRNYFASVGLLLAFATLLAALPQRLSNLTAVLPLIVITVFSAVTAMRAREWSNPIQFAYAEAAEHPDSSRANYELGRTLVVASGYRPDSKLITPARQAFEQATNQPNSGAAPYAGLIVMSGHMHVAEEADWWYGLVKVLRRRPPSDEDVSALQSIYLCQLRSDCPPHTSELLQAFLAALGHPQTSARLSAIYGAFAANGLGDYALAAEMFSEAIALSPGNVDYRLELAGVRRLQGDTKGVSDTLEQVSKMGPNRSQLERISALRRP